MPKTLKAKHSVKITSDFEVRTQLGALTVTTLRTGDTETVAPPREHVSTYKAGDVYQFSNKADAVAFWKAHNGKALYMGKIVK
jgi:hypothetical protein